MDFLFFAGKQNTRIQFSPPSLDGLDPQNRNNNGFFLVLLILQNLVARLADDGWSKPTMGWIFEAGRNDFLSHWWRTKKKKQWHGAMFPESYTFCGPVILPLGEQTREKGYRFFIIIFSMSFLPQICHLDAWFGIYKGEFCCRGCARAIDQSCPIFLTPSLYHPPKYLPPLLPSLLILDYG